MQTSVINPKVHLTSVSLDVEKRARYEMMDLKQTVLGTEHMILAMLKLQKGIPKALFSEKGIDHDRFREIVSSKVGVVPDDHSRNRSAIATKRMEEVLEFAAEEAEKLDEEQVKPEHFLAVLLRPGKAQFDVAEKILIDLGFSSESLHTEVRRLIKNGSAPSAHIEQTLHPESQEEASEPAASALSSTPSSTPPIPFGDEQLGDWLRDYNSRPLKATRVNYSQEVPNPEYVNHALESADEAERLKAAGRICSLVIKSMKQRMADTNQMFTAPGISVDLKGRRLVLWKKPPTAGGGSSAEISQRFKTDAIMVIEGDPDNVMKYQEMVFETVKASLLLSQSSEE